MISATFLRSNASTVRSGPSPSICGASIRLFAGRLLIGGEERRATRFQDFCVSVPIQRDVPELPFETSSAGLNLRFDKDGGVYTTHIDCRWAIRIGRAHFCAPCVIKREQGTDEFCGAANTDFAKGYMVDEPFSDLRSAR